MKLILLPDESQNTLLAHYSEAFKSAVKIYIVSAYLTEWDTSLVINSDCKVFRFIIGRDFGITRKAACYAVLKWLPNNLMQNFLVADSISGFHPKAVFWQDSQDKYHCIVGSSNLTNAAFKSNYEANAYSSLSQSEFAKAEEWINKIEKQSDLVSGDWLEKKYKEAKLTSRKPGDKNNGNNYKLPKTPNSKVLAERREQIIAFEEIRKPLLKAFTERASNKISDDQFYDALDATWSNHRSRFQGKGWERSKAGHGLESLSNAFIAITKAAPNERDDIVAREMDRLKDEGVSSRKAFLSEILCHYFPDSYPILNKPVKEWLRRQKLRPARGLTEGGKYIDLAIKLRLALHQNPTYEAKNLAELDAVIWYWVNNSSPKE
ncbi:MAG: phospholipase D family protein [Candidatus Methylopumilus sp.]